MAEVGSVKDAIQQAALARPDLIVMEVRLRVGSDMETAREIRARQPEVRVLAHGA